MFPYNPKGIGPSLLVGAGIAALYGVVAFFSLNYAEYENVAPVWPAAGLAFAALWTFGLRFAPAVCVGSFVANLLHPLTATAPLEQGFLLRAGTAALADGAAPWLGVWSLMRIAGHRLPFDRTKDFGGFLFLSVCAATAAGALAGNLPELAAGGNAGFLHLWLSWWLGDAAAVLVIGSFLLVWAHRRPDWQGTDLQRAALLFVLCAVALTAAFRVDAIAADPYSPFFYLAAPFVLWAGLGVGLHGVTLVLFLFFTALFLPFGGLPAAWEPDLATAFQAYFLILAAAGLLIAVLRRERDLARRIFERAQRQRFDLARRLRRSEAAREELEHCCDRLEERLEKAQAAGRGRAQAARVAADFHAVFDLMADKAAELDAAGSPAPEALKTGIEHGRALAHRHLIGTGRFEVYKERIEAADLVRGLAGFLPRDGAGGALEVELGEGAPPLHADALLLRQALLRFLFEQGCTGRPRGRPACLRLGRAERIERSAGELLLLEPTSAGPFLRLDLRFSSMAEEEAPDLEEENALSVVFRVVQAHGGSLALHPERDGGGVLTIHLPCLCSEPACAPEPPGGRRRVLVVEDDELLCDIVRRALAGAGIVAEFTGTAAEALRVLERAERLDAVLLDLGLPDRPGSWLLEHIHGRDRDLPVVVMTGYGEYGLHHLKRLEFGELIMLPKPFRIAELEQALARALARRANAQKP